MINQLINVISKEAALFETFLGLLEEQKRMLVKNDLPGLEAVTEKQRERVVESRLLSQQREMLISRIKQQNAIDGDLTVSRLLELIDDREAEQLRKLRDAIFGLNDKIAETRNSNAMLINQSRDCIAKTMTMLSQINSPEPNYARSGKSANRASTALLDRRA